MGKFCRNGCWLSIFCVGSVILSGCANQLAEKPAARPSKSEIFINYLKDDLYNLPGKGLDEAWRTYLEPDNLKAILMVGGASIALHQSNADKRIDWHMTKHRVLSGFVDESFNVLGCPGTHFAATGIWYALAIDKQDQFNKDRAWTMMTALSVTGATTAILKAIRDNHTPNGKRWAWPSGHTASSFTVASVLDEFYGPKVGIPAYLLAGFIGFRMMDAGDHWASDVVFGASLGWIVGHSVAGRQRELELAGFKVLPFIGNSTTGSSLGVSLVKRF